MVNVPYVGLAGSTFSSAVTAAELYMAVAACVAVMMVVPGTPRVTAPVDELIEATDVLLEAQVNAPVLVEPGTATEKPAPR